MGIGRGVKGGSHAFRGRKGLARERLEEVDVGDGGVVGFEFCDEVVTSFFEGVWEFSFPEEEEAVGKVGYKNGGLVGFFGGRLEFELEFGEFREEAVICKDFLFAGLRVKDEENKVRFICRREKVPTAGFQCARNPAG